MMVAAQQQIEIDHLNEINAEKQLNEKIKIRFVKEMIKLKAKEIDPTDL